MTASSSGTGFWSCIDAIVVINLDRRADRWADIQAHLLALAPAEKIHRLSAVLGVNLPGYDSPKWFRRTPRAGTWAGRAGCTLSHRNALRLAQTRGWKRILILEDDARLSLELNGPVGDMLAAQLTMSNGRIGVCYLGYTSPRGPSRPRQSLHGPHVLYELLGASTTHAYIVDSSLYQPLLDQLPQTDEAVWAWVARHTAIDRWYSLALARITTVTAVSPQLAVQAPSHSDITARQSAYEEAGTGEDLAPLRPTVLPYALAHFLSALQDRIGAIPRGLKCQIRRLRGF